MEYKEGKATITSVPVKEFKNIKPFMYAPNSVDFTTEVGRPRRNRNPKQEQKIMLKRMRPNFSDHEERPLKVVCKDINPVEYGKVETETIRINGKSVVYETLSRKSVSEEKVEETKTISFISPDPQFSKLTTTSFELDHLLKKIIMASQPVPFNEFYQNFRPTIPEPEKVIVAKLFTYFSPLDPVCFASTEYGECPDLFRFEEKSNRYYFSPNK